MKIVCINENPREWVNNNNNQIEAMGEQLEGRYFEVCTG